MFGMPQRKIPETGIFLERGGISHPRPRPRLLRQAEALLHYLGAFASRLSDLVDGTDRDIIQIQSAFAHLE
jgi:hypothetical protein